jgi:sodium/potassium-transporting ATPase subunit alpha
MNRLPSQISQLQPERVYSYLHSRKEGLSQEEVHERQVQLGKNTLEMKDRWKLVHSLSKQFTNFFTILLIISAIICFVAQGINPGEGMNILGWALLGVSLLNALFSFIQEYRAEKAMEALKKFLPQLVEVKREGRIDKTPAEEIVPGDIILLSEGDKISADARIVEADSLMANNAPLTGEAIPCRLSAEPVRKPLQESENIAFAGCTIVRGAGRAVVFATGLHTEFGKVAHLSQTIKRSSSPLERETSHMVRVLTIIACSMGFSFFLYGVTEGRSLWVNLVFMMGIIVANVPEGLLPTFTLSLAMGSLRMAKKNVLVKSLNAVESLGAVHVICTDKTGTLTLNSLTITELVDTLSGNPLKKEQQQHLLACAFAASEVRQTASQLLGDPLDVAVAQKYIKLDGSLQSAEQHSVHHFAFDVEKRRSAGIFTHAGKCIFVVKGAFEALAPMIGAVTTASSDQGEEYSTIPISNEKLNQAEDIMRRMASRGLRVIAVAYKTLAEKEDVLQGRQGEKLLQKEFEKDLVLGGFFGIEDPIRPEVPSAVEKCHTAGINVVLVTGDHPATAVAVARNSGIIPRDQEKAPDFITGEMLQKLPVSQLMEKLDHGVRIFARTTPEQKMKIVTALKNMEKVVAMTGDGVNDAPALKAADVGIAMGEQGTDVARESAQIILLDDNFASIVAGIEEGRTVFENIKKFTNYVLVSNGPEILPYLLYILLPVPLALNVIQILSIDLGTDIIPSMGLGQEPPASEVMDKPPRDLSQGLLTPALIIHSYLFLGLLEGAWSLFLFFYVLVDGGWHYGMDLSTSSPLYKSAMGITLATILLMQIGNLIGRRYSRLSGLNMGIFTNRLILLGILVQIVFSWATLYFPPIRNILGTGPVAPGIYFLAWFGIILIFGADYARKRFLLVFEAQKQKI